MVVAIVTVHLSRGFWTGKGGYEFNLSLIAAAVALALTGPGRYSLDSALGIHLPEPLTLLVGTIALIAGVAVTLVTRSPQPQAETKPQPPCRLSPPTAWPSAARELSRPSSPLPPLHLTTNPTLRAPPAFLAV